MIRYNKDGSRYSLHKGLYEHLVNSVPNNRLTRYLVGKFNQRMRRDGSRYRLHIRYRGLMDGRSYRNDFGDIYCQDARRFSLYLRRRNLRGRNTVGNF